MADSPSLIGLTISHDHILDKIGVSSVGGACKAHDTQLDRFVALMTLVENRGENGNG